MAKRQLRLTAFMRPASLHTGAWRYPGAYPDANFNFAHLKSFAQKLEQGKFDAFFMADHMAVLNMPLEALKRSHTVTSFEPFTLLSALAVVTEHLGLMATGSTTFDAPYHIARRFASLDHISGGRAGWNIVTTSNPDAALNFGLDEHMEHSERYARAREFYDVVTGLWDSWADDAFIHDAESGIYVDPDKLHVLDHKGKYLSVRGPLNIARPIQGWPVIVQAGASEAGRQLAAETAEAVFTAQSNLAVGREFYADVKGRMEKLGRSRDHMKILPGCFVVVGDTVEEARTKRAHLDSLVHYANAIGSLSIALGHDASKFDPDGPLPEIPESNASQERPRARDRACPAREPDGAPACAAARRLFRARDGRHAQDHRRRDGGMARDRRLRRLHRAVPLPAGRARRFRRQGGAGAAAARPVPARLRGQDAARESSACRGRRTGSSRHRRRDAGGATAGLTRRTSYPTDSPPTRAARSAARLTIPRNQPITVAR